MAVLFVHSILDPILSLQQKKNDYTKILNTELFPAHRPTETNIFTYYSRYLNIIRNG